MSFAGTPEEGYLRLTSAQAGRAGTDLNGLEMRASKQWLQYLEGLHNI